MLYGIRFTARKLVTYLLLTTFLLSLAGLVATYLLWVKQYTMALGFIPLFNMDAEYNIPSLFSVALIGGNALLLLLIAKHASVPVNKKRFWKVLAWVFLFLAFDELTSTHERIGGVVYRLAPNAFTASESRYWILPFSILLVLFALYFFRFFWQLPSVVRLRFLVAGLIYVGGAMGIEWLGELYIWDNVNPDFTYGVYATAEEMVEMTGMVLFMWSLLLYLQGLSNAQSFQLQFQVGNQQEKGQTVVAVGKSAATKQHSLPGE